MAVIKEDQLRIELVKGAKKIYENALNQNNEGNLSVRNGKKEEIFITPSANQYDTLTSDQVVHISFDGTPLSTGKLPSTEAVMHLAIYKARPKVQSVIHTHSTFATILSIVRKRIPIIMEEQVVYLGGSIELAPHGEAGEKEIGEAALMGLGYRNGALLASHGAIVCGKSITQAVKNAELVEKFAKVYWGVLQVGEPVVFPEDKLVKFRTMFKRMFANCPRSLLKTLQTDENL